mmetsp:Transcript_47763/g.144444  ORF Transcript_47763/g.144444 Transcript_47763/m.144444 type:complete len:137 (-) Transcript_47763:29-439(-)
MGGVEEAKRGRVKFPTPAVKNGWAIHSPIRSLYSSNGDGDGFWRSMYASNDDLASPTSLRVPQSFPNIAFSRAVTAASAFWNHWRRDARKASKHDMHTSCRLLLACGEGGVHFYSPLHVLKRWLAHQCNRLYICIQ